jgi:hypothetical protein
VEILLLALELFLNRKELSSTAQHSTDTNDIILKMLYADAKGMDQNIVVLHATNGMLDKDANAARPCPNRAKRHPVRRDRRE